MSKPLVFDLFAQHDFRPADVGYLVPGGVVRADTFVMDPAKHLMPVRALDRIDAGRRGRFVELAVPAQCSDVADFLI